jgi:predicted TIM-barrel fold metal-dependent hydrolase
MDEAGVRTGMLCAWWGPRAPLISNDAVAAIAGSYPGRFVGVAAVDLARPVEAVRELRRCVRDLGFRALRVVPWLWNLPPDDRRYYPLYAECVDLGLDDETTALFLHGNAERVFGLAPAPEPASGPGPAAGRQDTSTERAQA